MSTSYAAIDAIAAGIGASFSTAVVLTGLVALVWPHLAAVLTDHQSSRWRTASPPQCPQSSRASALRYAVVVGVIIGVLSVNALYTTVRYDIWSGIVAVVAVAVNSVIVCRAIIKAMRRSIEPTHWLRDHGLTSFEIGVIEKSHTLSLATRMGLLTCWVVAIAVPLQLLAGDARGLTAPASLITAAVVTPLVLAGEQLDRKFRIADQFQLHIRAACIPEPGREPHHLRIRPHPDVSPDNLWQLGLQRDRAALIAASTLLQRLLWRRTRKWRGIDQAAFLDSAQPIFDDLAALARSDDPIALNPVVTRAVRLGLLGDLAVLGSHWAKAHRASDDRAWNPWSLKRVLTIVTTAVSVLAAAIGAVATLIKS